MVNHVLSTVTSRFGRRRALLFVIALSAALLGACGDSGSSTDDAATATSTDESDATGTTEPGSTDTESTSSQNAADSDDGAAAGDPGDDDPLDLDQLREALDATIARNSAHFSLDVTQTLPVTGQDQATMRRMGSFDQALGNGTGTQQFLGQTSAAADLPGYNGEEIEHRLVDGTYWLLNPVSDPPSWIGYELAAFAEQSTGDPTVSFDGDIYLVTVRDALTTVTDVVEFDDGSQGWAVQASADDLLPLVVTAGVQERLGAAGLQPTGVESTISLAVDPDGMVIGLIADLNEWWQAVIDQTVGATEAPAGMVFQFQVGEFDAAVEAETPCAAPEELLEPDALPALVCDEG